MKTKNEEYIMTFKTWQATKVLLPWLLHCQLWGIDTEHEDANKRVYSYAHGYYIDIDYRTPAPIYSVEYGHGQTFSSGDLETVERYFWDDCACIGINPPTVERYRSAVRKIVIDGIDKMFIKAVKISDTLTGDISPEENSEIEAIKGHLQDIIMNHLKVNE